MGQDSKAMALAGRSSDPQEDKTPFYHTPSEIKNKQNKNKILSATLLNGPVRKDSIKHIPEPLRVCLQDNVTHNLASAFPVKFPFGASFYKWIKKSI